MKEMIHPSKACRKTGKRSSLDLLNLLAYKGLQKALLLLFACCTFNANAQDWNQVIKAVASDRGTGDKFGHSVSISGDYAIVGANTEDEDAIGGNTISDAGAAYIFKNTEGNWEQVQKITASDRGAVDRFGHSVSISGDYAIIGAYSEDHDAAGGNTVFDAGSAYIFKNTGGNWAEVQKITASDRGSTSFFGSSVSISGDYAIVGAYSEDYDPAGGGANIPDAGAAYIFKNTAGNWSQVQKITASDFGNSDNFGRSVSISGNYAIVGAHLEDEDAAGGNTLLNTGSAYIFKNTAGIWAQLQKITASDRNTQDYFGYSVYISGDYAIVGAYLEDEDPAGGNTISNAGSAYIFKNTEGIWAQVQKITASDRGGDNSFGHSVSISGDYAIVGAYTDDHDAVGGNSLPSAGSAYIFKNTGGNWAQAKKITASDRGADDSFGNSVSISGNYAMVGASKEDEDIAGENTLTDAGAAYIFKNCNTFSTDVQAGCNSYTWIDGITYTSDNNTATYSLTNSAGCDSIISLNLSFTTVDASVTQNDVTLTANAGGASYQWIDCGNGNASIPDATSQSYIATDNGSYSVLVTQNNCSKISPCFTISDVTSNKGVSRNALSLGINIYPNPASEKLHIDFSQKQSGILRLYNSQSKLVLKQVIDEETEQMEISGFDKGVYLLQIQTEKGLASEKILIQ